MKRKEKNAEDKAQKQFDQRKALFFFEYALDDLMKYYKPDEVRNIFKIYFKYIEG